MKILFTGDLFLGGDLLGKSCTNVVSSKLFDSSDFRIVNLEQAVSDSDYVEDKCTLYTDTQSLVQLKQMKVDAVNLAHNHIQDKGLDGIEETVKNLNGKGIKTFGAGCDIYESRIPLSVSEDLVVMGYCDYGRPYLNQIEVAGKNKPGVNPLRYEVIIDDLDRLEGNQKAILYFHWGIEHVWLPPVHDIKLAKKLLEDDRVVTIIGMHCHRFQGVLDHNGKKAFMGLGNFLFPNFYIAPRTQIAYPDEESKKKIHFVTRQYHAVQELTYKKWRLVNRASKVLLYNTDTHEFETEFLIQDDNQPTVKPVGPLLYFFCCFLSCFLSILYKLPSPVYSKIASFHARQTYFFWRAKNRIFYMRQIGFDGSVRKLIKKIFRVGE